MRFFMQLFFLALLASVSLPMYAVGSDFPHCMMTSQAQPRYLINGFYYHANSLVFASGLDKHKDKIKQLDSLNFSTSLLGIIHGQHGFKLADISKQNLLTIHQWLQKNHLKTRLFVSLGHWSSHTMRQIFTKPQVQKQFIGEVIKLLKDADYGVSGIDIDWENNPRLHPKETKHFGLFIRRLRQAMNQHGLQRDCLTIDLPSSVHRIKHYPAAKDWQPYVDWANLMAYEFYLGPRYTELDAALGEVKAGYPGKAPNYHHISLVKLVNEYINRGVQPRKLVFTLPFYGKMAYVHHVNFWYHHGLHQKLIDHRSMMAQDYASLYYRHGNYEHPKKDTSFYQYTFEQPKAAHGKHAFWFTYFITKSPQAGEFYGFVTYPDPIAIKEISEYVKKNNFLGLSSWQVTYDLPFNNHYSLLRTMSKVLKGGIS